MSILRRFGPIARQSGRRRGRLRQFSTRGARRQGWARRWATAARVATSGSSRTTIRPPSSEFATIPFRRATDGQHGTSKRMHGSKGKDIVVVVPVGTMVNDRDGEPARRPEGIRATAGWPSEGGLGGQGNARFLSNNRRAPAFAEQGEVGQENWFNLELKLQADVALIGFPNVGKSTLIARVSAARPKIADYPFTTLVPNLGVVRVGARTGRPGDATEFVMADIPGLIEGAAEGRGLGHDFLAPRRAGPRALRLAGPERVGAARAPGATRHLAARTRRLPGRPVGASSRRRRVEG